MLKYIIVVVFAIGIFPSQTTTLASTQPKLTNEQIVYQLVDKYSAQYKVSKTQMLATLKCENRDFDFDLQSGIVTNGKREQSFGVAQIHLPSHPNITLEQATDPDFSIHFMAKEFASGNARAWTCWRKLQK